MSMLPRVVRIVYLSAFILPVWVSCESASFAQATGEITAPGPGTVFQTTSDIAVSGYTTPAQTSVLVQMVDSSGKVVQSGSTTSLMDGSFNLTLTAPTNGWAVGSYTLKLWVAGTYLKNGDVSISVE